jgi:hypothetical protein
MRWCTLVMTLLSMAAASSAEAQPGDVRLPRVFVEVEASANLDSSAEWQAAGIGVRLTVPLPGGLSPQLDRLMQVLNARQVPVWIATPLPQSGDASLAWQDGIDELIRRYANRVRVLELVVADEPAEVRRFAILIGATRARSRLQSMVTVAIGGVNRATLEAAATSLSPELAAYLHALAISGDAIDDAAVAAFHALVPDGFLLRHGLTAGPGADPKPDIVREALATIGTPTVASAWKVAVPAALDAGRAMTAVRELFANPIEVLDSAAVELRLTDAGRDVGAAVTSRVLLDQKTFATWLVYEGSSPPGQIEASLRLPVDGTPAVVDVLGGHKTAAGHYVRDAEAAQSRATIPLTGRPMLVNFSEGASDLFSDRTETTATRQLSIDEIIARHRQYQARQDALVQHYRASARMEQHFRPSLTDPGYDVVTENTYFVSKDGVEFEERSFSVNGSKWGSDRPAFPLLQAEKVLSLPLELRLGQDYRYALAGTERVGEVEAYRVRFEPTREDEALYRGTVWIDRRTFARVKVQAVQTRTSAPIVSNEEIHTYEPVATVDGIPVTLLTRLAARQIVLIAGRNLLLEKLATFSGFGVNEPAFAAERDAARRSDRIMYRDTDRGLRYYVKEGELRVVSERPTTRARAMAMGLLVDPSFGYPLPIFGLNILDFEFRGRPDTQFALLFAGVLAAGNIQRPKLGGTPLDASLDFFAIAPPASDRLYVGGGEREAERLLTWPLTTGLNLGWQYTPFQKAILQYQLRFDGFVRDRTTSESFVVPSSTLTNGIGGAWEYKRGGYSVAANGAWFARSSWKPWGPAGALEVDPPRTYAKYAAHVSRDLYVNVFQKIHLNGSYFGGQDLDRFSRYQFGLFDDTRLHGVPASGVRFDRVAMARGSYSLNIFEQYRVDLFLEQAWGEDRAVDRQWRPLTGVGAAVNLRAPFNTILRAEGGKSFLPEVYRDVGSVVFQVMVLKPLR